MMKANTRGILITTSGAVRVVLVSDYTDIYAHIGAIAFDCVRMKEGATIYVDDEGILAERPVNTVATIIAMHDKRVVHCLCGDALILGTDSEGDSIDCPQWVYDEIADIEKISAPPYLKTPMRGQKDTPYAP